MRYIALKAADSGDLPALYAEREHIERRDPGAVVFVLPTGCTFDAERDPHSLLSEALTPNTDPDDLAPAVVPPPEEWGEG